MKKFISLILFLMLMVLSSTAFAQMAKREALAKFFQAEEQYKDGVYQKAINNYEAILDTGLESSALYYNLGNSYYRNGDLGRAVLNFKRALRLKPRDGDIIFNLNYALSSVKTVEKGEKEKHVFLKAVLERFSLDEMAKVALLLFAVLVAIGLAALRWQWPKKKIWLWASIVAVAWIFVCGLFLVKSDMESAMAIMLEATPAKFEPNYDATTHFQLSEGMEVKIIEGKGLWFKVRRQDGKLGWVENTTMERI